jgi:hypothetical protein
VKEDESSHLDTPENAVVRSDILFVERQKQEFTPIAELKQIETLLQTLETKLSHLYQFLPRLDRRRALVDFGGTALKFLFGTAIDSDVRSLHSALNELQSKNSDIVLSLSHQVTYIKQLDTITRINSNAIDNLSDIVKNNMIRLHDKFQQLARDIVYLNLTLHGQSDLYTVIRQLEFSLLQLTQQLEELFNAIQFVILGTLLIKLISLTVLQNILRNISLQLPDG